MSKKTLFLMLPMVFACLFGAWVSSGDCGESYKLTIATGGTGGTYYPCGGGVGELLRKKLDIIEAATAEVTAGSVENAQLVNRGKADMGLICWIGQSLAIFALPTAVRLGLFEPEDQLDSSVFLFERYSQGIMDVLLAWILPLAGLLMILENQYWPIFALVGGGVYLYFPGVFMITRIIWKKNGRKV